MLLELSAFDSTALLLTLAAAVGMLGLLLRQPLIVSFIAAGIIAGPDALGLVSDPQTVHLLAEIGIAYSDSWGYDSTWLSLLFHHAGMLPRFRLEALRSLLDESQLSCWKRTKEALIRERGIQRHRAGEDARLLQLTYLRTRDAGC